MNTFIIICGVFGLLLVLLDFGAKAASVAPSMYRSDVAGTGWCIVAVAAVAFACVRWLP